MIKFDEIINYMLLERNELITKLNENHFNESVEVKTINNVKYIYLRKKVLGKNTSKYIDKYSDGQLS